MINVRPIPVLRWCFAQIPSPEMFSMITKKKPNELKVKLQLTHGFIHNVCLHTRRYPAQVFIACYVTARSSTGFFASTKKRASKNTHFDDGDTRLQTSRKTQHKNDIYEKSGYRISLSYHSENIKLIFAAERSLRFFLSLARITFQSTSDFISDYSFLCTWVLCLFVFNLMTLLRLRFCFGSFDSSRCIFLLLQHNILKYIIEEHQWPSGRFIL